MSEFSMHTHTCGELRASNIGSIVTLTGWVRRRRDLGALIFIDLRDREGYTQVCLDPDLAGDAFHAAEEVRPEWTLRVTGVVRARPDGMANHEMPTGEIEVIASELDVLSRSKTPPFPLDDGSDTAEDLRLRYRYLDIRRPKMQNNLRLRSDFTFAIREALHKMSFTEVETPALFKSTPEGARDFLVASRTQPGHFYALPQSPQLLKQLLMIGGVERYYQVARCFRDEDLRADRQPEFTQVDIEMSFVTQDDVMGALEEMLAEAFAKVGVTMPRPLRRLSYLEAMKRYGTDKPDTRFAMELQDVTSLFENSQFKVFNSVAHAQNQVIMCINAKGAGSWARARIDKLSSVASSFGAKGLAWIAFREDGSVTSPIAKFLSDAEMDGIRTACAVEAGDLVLFGAGPWQQTCEVMGAMRLHMASELELAREGHDFLWVTDFPLVHWDEDAKRYAAEHQPFTQPVEADIDRLEDDPLSVGSHTYDFVMDGYEAGGGGMRVHDAELQMRILKLLGFTEESAREQFGFLLDALEYGAPPMGGFALGLDRVCMLLAGADSIREVMAFPKTTSGSDLMSDAPSGVTEGQLKELSLALR